jgi:methyl-accepting chemotaxis protein
MKQRLTLDVRLPAIMSILLLALFVAIGCSVFASRAARDDTKVVNIAGRQRMLTQKYAKEVLDELSSRNLLAGAEQIASVASHQIALNRKHYTERVVGKLKQEVTDVVASADYGGVAGGIPLPATFVRELAEKTGESEGYTFALLSEWNINPAMGLHDGFEREAWRALAKDPKAPYQDLTHDERGLMLRYATADLASAAACVTCHNAHPDSPRKDFKLNDLMGMLVVSVPVTQDEEWAATVTGLRDGSAARPSEQTRALFESSMAALIEGGTTYSDLQMTQAVELPPTADSGIREQLAEAQVLWSNLRDSVASLQVLAVGSPEYLDQLRVLRTRNLETLKSLDVAVSQLQLASERRTNTATMVQYAMAGIAVLTFLMLTAFVRKNITGPLSAALQTLTAGSAQVSSASGLVAESSQSMAAGATEQAASMEEIAASLQELAAMTHQNTESAARARSLATQAQHDADSGHASVNNLCEAIAAIKHSADESAGIVKAIQEIAFQTNMLALNAAVEAARAGDAGKGFAVVAEEVRSLAQRAAAAAQGTSELIGESVTKAERGVAISREVTEAFARIAEGARNTNEIMAEVAAAGREQAQGIDQVNTGMSQLDQVTQSNAACSEESAAAAEELSAQAAAMLETVRNLAALTGIRQREDGVRVSDPVRDVAGEHGDAFRLVPQLTN